VPSGAATRQREIVLKGIPAVRVAAVPGVINRLSRAMTLLNNAWPKEWSPQDLVLAVQTGNRISLKPATATEEVALIQPRAGSALKSLKSMEISVDTRRKVEALIHGAVKLLK